MTALAQAFQELLAALDRTETLFLVGGSVASSAHGLARLTNDIDIVVDLPPGRAPEFCAAFGSAFYADRDRVSRAVAAGRPFNVIHLASAYKFDFFPVGNDAFGRCELAANLSRAPSPAWKASSFQLPARKTPSLPSSSVFARGGVSDRQWSDILGVIKVQADRLDRAYLRKWAAQLAVADLLDEVLR